MARPNLEEACLKGLFSKCRAGKIVLLSEANRKDLFTNKATLLICSVLGKRINISKYQTIKDR